MPPTPETALTRAHTTEPPAGMPPVPEHLSKQILWSGVLQTARGPCHCRVAELSREGARLTVGTRFPVGQSVTLVIAGVGLFRGRIAWEEPGALGVQFAPAPPLGAA